MNRHDPTGGISPAKSPSTALTDSFEVVGEWLGRESLDLRLTLLDPRLRGSRKHFLRFDLYPLYAPSRGNRHHGYWDLPLKQVKTSSVYLSLDGSDLIVGSGSRSLRFPPGWKGSLQFNGYCMLHVSLWKRSFLRAVQTSVASARYVLLPNGGDLPLIQAYLPVTYRCNLNCPMCMRHTADDFQAADISPDVLAPLLDASPRLHSVSLTGIGEPLLNANLYDILRSFKTRMPPTAQAGLTTNGTLMTAERARQLIDAGINWICASLDGATKATTERIRPGLNFDQVVGNIAGLAAYRRKSRTQRLWLSSNFVMMEENVREVSAFVQLAASLGLDTVIFSHLRDYRTGTFRTMGEETLTPFFQEAKELGARLGVGVILPPSLRPQPEPQCHFLSTAYVRLSGDVVPCCRMLDGATPGPVKIFGNVKKTLLFDIWNNEEYRMFRRNVIEGDLPHECQGCDYSRGMLSA